MKRLNSFALGVVALLGLSTMVEAEIVHYGGDDGHFCTSKGYLAFDYNQNVIEGTVVKNMHLLKVVRFGPEHGIYFAGEVSLPAQFSTFWMDCDAERVEIVGWGPRGINGLHPKCDIKIGAPAADVGSAECVDDVAYDKPGTEELPRLEITIQSENATDPPPIVLEAPTDTDHAYQLRRHLTQKHIAQKHGATGLNSKTTAEVVELDQKGTILKRLVIYEYVHFEAAD